MHAKELQLYLKKKKAGIVASDVIQNACIIHVQFKSVWQCLCINIA